MDNLARMKFDIINKINKLNQLDLSNNNKYHTCQKCESKYLTELIKKNPRFRICPICGMFLMDRGNYLKLKILIRELENIRIQIKEFGQ